MADWLAGKNRTESVRGRKDERIDMTRGLEARIPENSNFKSV